jgi:hypothetical protein
MRPSILSLTSILGGARARAILVGDRRPTPRALRTREFTYRRTRPSFSTVTIFITTRRISRLVRPVLLTTGPRESSKLITFFSDIDRFVFNPDRYVGDTLTCLGSSKLPNVMDRGHWAFGAGYVISYMYGLSIQYFVCEPSSPLLTLICFAAKGVTSAQASMSPNGAMACDVMVAVGF